MLPNNYYSYISKRSSLILLYHATFSNSPDDLKVGLHNVKPDIIFEQLGALSESYKFVTLEEWFQNQGKPGIAAITFDDGYKSVLYETLPILVELNMPATIFINGCTLKGEVIWRDKIRYLINLGLVEDFLNWVPYDCSIKEINPENFYFKTKKNINSKEVSDLIATYFQINNIKLNQYCVDDWKQLIDHPLITYGNHTLNHYVLSTLSYEQQYFEIKENERILNDIGVNTSKIFSVPFGAKDDFNEHTLDICSQLSYKGILLSRNRLNRNLIAQNSISYGERFIVPSSVDRLITRTYKIFVKSFIYSSGLKFTTR